MITGDFREVKDLADDLRKLNERGLAFASRETLNQTAWKARQQAQAIIERKMTQRNRWTKGSVRVEKARSLNIRAQEAAVGSTESYMETQEFGGVDRARGKHGVPIPTSYSAGQMGAKPRTRLPRRANRLPNIKLKRSKTRRMSRKQRLAATVRQAVAGGQKYVFLDFGKHKGIVKVLGGGRRLKSGRSSAKLRMVQDLTERSVRIPATPWLRPAVNLASLRVDDFYRKALLFQLRRLKTAR
jgi:hypothetical protein